MENWRKQDLDKKTTGEVALEVFSAEQDLADASRKRAEAAARVADIREELERAQKEYSEAAQDENYCYKEHKDLKNYLVERLQNAT